MKITFAVLLATIHFVAAQSPIWGQCGGQGWTGSTACASGSVCTYSNPYYSQCLPGTATSTVQTSTPTSTTAGSTPTGGSSGLPWIGGVNTAGYDFTVSTDGSFNGTGVSPPTNQFSHFASQGAKIFRIPFAWQLMTPTVGGNIDSNFFSRYDTTVQAALATGAYVILDLHNYARWNGQVIGQGGPTNAQYASLWSQVAAKYQSNNKIIFGIMNEPHDLPQGTALWAQSVQAAVNAIRTAGATSQVILIPGSSWSSAQTLPTEAGPDLLKVTDPAGGVNKLVFDVHKYLDSDNSGTHTECVTNNVAVFTTLVQWLQQNGRQALLSETGGGNTASCVTDVGQELAYIKSQSPTMVGFTMWAAGSFDTTYELTLTPFANGTDQMLWTQAVKPYL